MAFLGLSSGQTGVEYAYQKKASGGANTTTELDSLDFAKEALSRVSQIAGELGARNKICFAGCLAARLLIARKALDSADASQMPKLERRIPKLMDDLERVCMVS